MNNKETKQFEIKLKSRDEKKMPDWFKNWNEECFIRVVNIIGKTIDHLENIYDQIENPPQPEKVQKPS